MPNTDRLMNHQDGLDIISQLGEIASALESSSNKVTGVKGSSETNYRTGNVNISPADLGLGHIQEDISELSSGKADTATSLAGYGITDSYTKSEVDNMFSEIETNVIWKQAVTNYSNIATTYPNPSKGWTVNVTSTNQTYRYDGSDWVMISANMIPEATTSVSGLMTSAQVTKLNGIEEGAKVNVQSDWNQANSSHDGFIKNKPNIPSKTSDLINDSDFVTSTHLATVATTGEFSDLENTPTTISGYGISNAYTKNEVDNLVSSIESNVTWKEAVTNYSDITITYPNPEEGWTVNVTSTNTTYRYNGTEWVLINTNIIPNATTSVNGLMTTTHVEKLNGIETGAQKNVQADWDEIDSTSDAFINNKPDFLSFVVDETKNETTVIAEKSHNTDDYFDLNGTLVRALTNIDIGDVFTEDINIESTNIGTEMSSMKASFTDGCNTIVQAVTAKGQTPASNSPTDIAEAIGNISTGGSYTEEENEAGGLTVTIGGPLLEVWYE